MNSGSQHNTLNLPCNNNGSLLSTESVLRFHVGTTIVYVFNNGSLLFIEDDGNSTFVNRSEYNYDQVPFTPPSPQEEQEEEQALEIEMDNDDDEEEEEEEFDSPQSPPPQDYRFQWCPKDHIDYIVLD